MARKSNPQNDKVMSGGAAAQPRRKTTIARPKRSTAAAAKPVSPVEDSTVPSPDEVARLAYLLWLDRGCPEGSPEEDWLRAEQALRQQVSM